MNTREVGSFNYMSWEQILELYDNENVEIGNHSHTHEYLIDFTNEEIRKDLENSKNIFKKELGKNSKFFSCSI